jgi:HopA1 effector protein family
VSEHRAAALSALAALQVRSPTSYSWCGTTSRPLAPEVETAMSPEVAREFLLYQLQQELYNNFYCRGFPVPGEDRPGRLKPLGSPAFVARLVAANRGRGSLQPGWQIRGEDEGRLVVERDGLSLWVPPTQTVAAGKSPGRVSLRLPSELRKASPGFYLALGEISLEEEGGRLLRMYWHLTSAAAALLLDRLTGSLNRSGIPFQLKVVDDPDRYSRCDAGVLYVSQARYAEVMPTVRATYELLRGELRATTPALTKQLAPGLGLAEDPGDGQSFGMHRMQLLARAALRAYEQGAERARERTVVLQETFAEAGLDLDRPYLSSRSGDRYELAA